MTTRRSSHRLAAAALVVASMVAGACSGGGVDDLASDASAVVTTTTPAATPAASDDCRGFAPTASYPARSPMPIAGAMPAGSTMRAIQDRGRLAVGVSADTLLFGAQNPLTGQIEGFDIDMLRLVAEAIFGPGGGDRLDIRVITYAQRIPSLVDRSVDLVAHTMTINCTRWNQVAFSTVYYDAGQKILVRRDSTKTSIGQLDEAGSVVCAPAGSTNIEALADYPGIVVESVDDITDCLVLFQQGKVEAVTADDTVLAGFADQDPYAVVVGEAFTAEPYGIAANAADTDLVQFVNGVLAAARADGRWAAIYEKWLSGSGVPTPAPPVADEARRLP